MNTTTTGDQTSVTLAKNGTGFVAAWVDSPDSQTPYTANVRAQLFDSGANKLGTELSIAAAADSVQPTDTALGFALSWRSSSDNSIRVQAYTGSGAVTGTQARISAPDSRYQPW